MPCVLPIFNLHSPRHSLNNMAHSKLLSDELKTLLNPEPLLDDEDELQFDGNASTLYKETGVDKVDVQGYSSIKKKQIQLLSSVDKKYSGKKIERKLLEQSDDESKSDLSVQDDNEAEDDIDDESFYDEEEENGEGEDEEDNLGIEADNEEDDNNDDADEDGEDYKKNESQNNKDEEVQNIDQNSDEQSANFLNLDIDKQMSKANSVKNQLLIYDNLFETRIKFQKLMQLINRLPQSQHFSSISNSKSILLKELLNESRKMIRKFYKNLLEINSHIKLGEEINEKRKAIDLPEGHHPKRFCSLRENYPNILDDWFNRTRFVHTKLKNFSSFDISPTDSIVNILQNKARLINRTKVKRSDYTIIGATDETENLNEIYNDDDFYHILLKDVIENNNDNVQDTATTFRKYVEIQRLRNKIKKKVDTKASKGRKIRYNVQEKLVNFMAPIDMTTMPDEARDELFKSLFSGVGQ